MKQLTLNILVLSIAILLSGCAAAMLEGLAIETAVAEVGVVETIAAAESVAAADAALATRARALYMTVNDTIEYHDSLVCRQVNIFRESQEQWEQKAEIKNKKDNLNVYLYPNPAKDKLKVLIDGDNEAGIIKIYDLTGALIADFNVNKNSTNKELDISSLSEGYYMIHFSLGDYNKVKTFVKIK